MKAIRIIFPAIFCIWVTSVFGQSWNVVFNRELGNNRMDYFRDVIEDKNGGYTVLGGIFPAGKTSYDFWLIRYNENGDTLWARTLGTVFNDVPKRLVQTRDGGYLLMGESRDENKEELLLIKTGTKGEEQWQKTVSGNAVYKGEDLVALADTGFLIAGAKGDNAGTPRGWIARFDGSGEMVWEKILGEDLAGCCKSVKNLPDGGFAITGQMAKANPNDCDMWLARLDSKYNVLWRKNVPSPGKKVWPECLCCSPDSCFLVVGWQGTCMGDITAENPTFDYDMLVTKVDKTGKVLWSKNFDKEGSEGGNAIAVRPDGKLIVAGIKATSFLGKIGPWLTLLDQDGNLVSEKLVEMHFNGDQAVKVINTSDGGIVVVGPGLQDEKLSRSNGWIMKFSDI